MVTPAPDPGFDFAIPATIEKYVKRLCFQTSRGHAGHSFKKDLSETGAVGTIYPEFGAINVTMSDIAFRGPRAIAEISVTGAGGGGFPSRRYKHGITYLFLAPAKIISDRPLAILVNSSDWKPDTLQFGTYELTENGEDPESGLVVPGFSPSVNDCRTNRRRACFLDSPTIPDFHLQSRILKAGGQTSVQIARIFQAATLDQHGNAVYTATGTWINLNGICFCQGTGCH